jgi:N4-gp56 family major capsid protein
MADTLVTDTVTANHKQKLIAQVVQMELAKKANLLQTVTDVSVFAEDGLSSIYFPTLSSFTVTKKTSGTAVDAVALTHGGDELLLNQQAVVQWIIEKKAAKQTRISTILEYAKRAAEAHVRAVNKDIADAIIAGVHTNNIIETESDWKKDFTNLIEVLDLQEVPSDQRVALVHPTDYKGLLQTADFVDASKYGASAPMYTGEIGQLYGVPVIKTSFVAAGAAVMYHKAALAFGFQSAPEYQEESALAHLGRRYSIDQLYGLKILQAGVLAAKLAPATP